MIGVSINSIIVPTVQTGCNKRELDSTLPIHLNGIIGQSDFRESIEKINRSTTRSGAMKAIWIIPVLMMIISLLGIVFGISYTDSYLIITIVETGLIVVGTISFLIGCTIMNSKYTLRVQQAIAEESMKYSTRSPTPCSWRLEGGRLIIDIGRATTAATGPHYSNQDANESTYLTRQYNQYTPPSYSDSSTAFCSKCGATRSDPSARFCSSCGQAQY